MNSTLSFLHMTKACDIWSLGVVIYILLSRRPPFYSADGSNTSGAISGRIQAGEYKFDLPEWSTVSEEAKSMIKRMLIVNPAERITISEIRGCPWLAEFSSDRLIHQNPAGNTESWEQIRVSDADVSVLAFI
jgi:serine/threonine protein kinase